MRKYMFLLLISALSMFGAWTVDVEPYITGSGCYIWDFDYCFGVASGASDFIDSDFDGTIPPPPPDIMMVDAYFFVDDPLVKRFWRDIRSDDHDTLFWDFRFVYRGGGTLTGYGLEWDPSELPSTGDFHIAVTLDTSDVLLRPADQPRDSIIWELADDMRDVTEISVSAPEVFYTHPVIRYIRDPESTSDHPTTPTALSLTAHPNPFNSAVEIDAPEGCKITITDTDGRHVATLGTGSTRWTPGKDQPSGVYLVTAEGDGESLTDRVVYMK